MAPCSSSGLRQVRQLMYHGSTQQMVLCTVSYEQQIESCVSALDGKLVHAVRHRDISSTDWCLGFCNLSILIMPGFSASNLYPGHICGIREHPLRMPPYMKAPPPQKNTAGAPQKLFFSTLPVSSPRGDTFCEIIWVPHGAFP